MLSTILISVVLASVTCLLALYVWGSRRRYPSLGRVVVLTGCDSGLGRATALHLHALGATVIATCLTDEGAKDLSAAASVQEVALDRRLQGRFFGSLHTLPLDVTSDESVARCVGQVRAIAPQGVHCLVNNAGLMTGSHLVEFTSLETYRRTMEVNYFGVVRMCHAFLPMLKKTARAGPFGVRIINISSFLGRVAPFSMSAYAASKFAVEAFSDALRQEMTGFDIDVVLIEPGAMNTPMAAGMKSDNLVRWESGSEELRAEYGEAYPAAMRRSGQMLDLISRDVRHLMSPLESAVCSMYPRHRYVCGADAFMFAVISSFCPSWLNDWFCLTTLGNPRSAAATLLQAAKNAARQRQTMATRIPTATRKQR